MNAMDMIVNFFKQGGVFLYPIAAVFVLGLAVAIERFIYLTRVSSGNRRLWDELSPLIAAGNIRGAMQVAEKTDSALSTIMRYGMSRISTARARVVTVSRNCSLWPATSWAHSMPTAMLAATASAR